MNDQQKAILQSIVKKPKTGYILSEIEKVASNKTVISNLKRFVSWRLIEVKNREKFSMIKNHRKKYLKQFMLRLILICPTLV